MKLHHLERPSRKCPQDVRQYSGGVCEFCWGNGDGHNGLAGAGFYGKAGSYECEKLCGTRVTKASSKGGTDQNKLGKSISADATFVHRDIYIYMCVCVCVV